MKKGEQVDGRNVVASSGTCEFDMPVQIILSLVEVPNPADHPVDLQLASLSKGAFVPLEECERPPAVQDG